jgi:hypothetical protein
MEIELLYSFTNKRDIWRIIPAGDNLVIEERQANTREVFFSCLNIETGHIIFRDFQTEEKFWIGIEVVHNGIIFFHKFSKPDMPGHKEIIAVDLYTQETLWSTSEYSFLLAYENKIYSYINLFEGKKYFILDYRTGQVLEAVADREININEIRYESQDNEFFRDAYFPELCRTDDEVTAIIGASESKPLAGRIECIRRGDYVFNSYHIEEDKSTLRNIFSIIEISSKKIIFKEILSKKTRKFIPETFFIKKDMLFMIAEKSILKVYSIK